MRTDENVLPLLAEAPLAVRGYLTEASNHTLLVRVGEKRDRLHAIYKPRRGERPLWDFPHGTLCRREVAAYAVSEFLGWRIVPPTVLREGPLGLGSVQLFVPHDPSRHYFVLVEDPQHHPPLARMAFFDLLVNNADRKGSHVLHGGDGHIWGVDHGLTFHVRTKLRTVIWELGGTPLPAALRADLARLRRAVAQPADALVQQLEELLSPTEIEVLGLRAAALTEVAALPDVDERHRPYPWPPL
ncbi:MAG TPA: SCO1664 family protein [Egibacteraceae bacterium]|nr:SCO1664 family protein [Egibacteraceae bacterium]